MEPLLNFYQATANIGTSGQPTREQFKDVANEGYKAVVNLAMHDSDNALADEGSLVASLGMSYFHVPVPFDSPSASHLKQFIRVMDALAGEKVLVHCAVNARVSAFMYKYLTLVKGFDTETATSPLLRQWHARMDPAWQSIINLTKRDLGL